MNDLKSIWNQVSCDSDELKIKLTDPIESIFTKLEKEQRLRDIFNPVLIIFIILFTIFFSYLVLQNSAAFSLAKIIGIVCITLASISIAILSQIVKMPLQKFTHDKSSTVFLKIVKEKLHRSKDMLILGLFLQIVFMTIGLYLIIFHGAGDYNIGYVYAFLGFMLGIGGASIGGGIAFFNTHYKSTHQLIDKFLTE